MFRANGVKIRGSFKHPAIYIYTHIYTHISICLSLFLVRLSQQPSVPEAAAMTRSGWSGWSQVSVTSSSVWDGDLGCVPVTPLTLTHGMWADLKWCWSEVRTCALSTRTVTREKKNPINKNHRKKFGVGMLGGVPGTTWGRFPGTLGRPHLISVQIHTDWTMSAGQTGHFGTKNGARPRDGYNPNVEVPLEFSHYKSNSPEFL